MMLLNVENLKKKFKDVKAVDDITFEVNKGEIFGLLGPNGAGKSTTISIISTLLNPTSGNVYYDGENISNNPKAIQRKMGIVPQEIALYPTLKGYENLKFWGNLYGLTGSTLKKRIDEVADIVGLNDKLKTKVENYSGGMKRRLNIAAALLHEPEILIMDEPTVGIDPQSRNHILETVLELNKKGMTIIYTSHYMEEVELLCTRISIMDKGQIVASGTKDELIDIIKGHKKIELTFDNISPDLLERLKKLEEVQDMDSHDNIVILTMKNGDMAFKDILNKVLETESSILSIDIKNPNLESVFLHLTGKALRD